MESPHQPLHAEYIDVFPCTQCHVLLQPQDFHQHLRSCAPGADVASPERPLKSCSHCTRTFLSDRIAKHESVCLAAVKKRVVPTKGLSQAFASYGSAKARVTDQFSDKKWHKLHTDLINNIRGTVDRERAVYSEYQQCPSCLRKFGPAAAERHIPKCREILHKASPPRHVLLRQLGESPQNDTTFSRRTVTKQSAKILRGSANIVLVTPKSVGQRSPMNRSALGLSKMSYGGGKQLRHSQAIGLTRSHLSRLKLI